MRMASGFKFCPIMDSVAFLFLVAAGLVLVALYPMMRGLATHRWPSTEGEVVESEVRDYNERSGYCCTFHVKYRFVAHGGTHVGTRLRFGLGSYLTQEAAEALAERYAVGNRITVFHHPTKGTAVLEKGFTQGSFFLLFTGLFLASVGVMVAMG